MPEHATLALDPKPLLASERVLPILDSIIEMGNNVLRWITFPLSWRAIEGENTALTEFLRRCNQVFERRNVACESCSGSVGDALPDSEWFIHVEGLRELQNSTCYNCLKHYCYNCMDDENGGLLLKFCSICENEYCYECSSTVQCTYCDEDYCIECRSTEDCGGCGNKCCSECIESCGGSLTLTCNVKFCGGCAYESTEEEKCGKCGKLFCNECWDFHGCNNCHRGYCGNCRESDEAVFCKQCA